MSLWQNLKIFDTIADQNATSGGVQDSAHLRGRAVDLRSQSSYSHFKIVEGAILAGFKRIGVYRNQAGSPSHVHVDDDPTLPQEVLWIGVSH
jgi:zinc D-Ala-D-Ala carboxypeptidase